MENSTALPLVSDCVSYEDEPLWIVSVLVTSAISALVAAFLRKRVQARARPDR